MKIRVNVGGTVVEAEGDTFVEAYEELSSLEEVFGAGICCGCCKKNVVRHRVRKNKDEDKFYEIVCLNQQCKAVLSLGCNKKGGGLYPHLKDKESKWKPNNGWEKWTGKPKTEADAEV